MAIINSERILHVFLYKKVHKSLSSYQDKSVFNFHLDHHNSSFLKVAARPPAAYIQ